MVISLSELKNKEVVNVKTGIKIGFVDDVVIDTELATVVSLIIYGRPRCMGFLGKEEDIVIKCDEIQLVGEDTILAKFDENTVLTKIKSKYIENLLK